MLSGQSRLSRKLNQVPPWSVFASYPALSEDLRAEIEFLRTTDRDEYEHVYEGICRQAVQGAIYRNDSPVDGLAAEQFASIDRSPAIYSSGIPNHETARAANVTIEAITENDRSQRIRNWLPDKCPPAPAGKWAKPVH
jgi:hypothetical protein